MAWSMKSDRELIVLARAQLSVDKIATKMKADTNMVLKAAKRLGVRLPAPKGNGSPK
jgi:hypothetical protein